VTSISVSSERLVMRLIKALFAGVVLAGILAISPTAAFARDGLHGGHYGYGRHYGYGGHYVYRDHYGYGGGYRGWYGYPYWYENPYYHGY
jgi:hypothetical protein